MTTLIGIEDDKKLRFICGIVDKRKISTSKKAGH